VFKEIQSKYKGMAGGAAARRASLWICAAVKYEVRARSRVRAIPPRSGGGFSCAAARSQVRSAQVYS
jgi:hypothetical protein